MLSCISHQGNIIKTPTRYGCPFPRRSNVKPLGHAECPENTKLLEGVRWETSGFLCPQPSDSTPGGNAHLCLQNTWTGAFLGAQAGNHLNAHQ